MLGVHPLDQRLRYRTRHSRMFRSSRKLLAVFVIVNALCTLGCEQTHTDGTTRDKLKALNLTPEEAKRILQELSTKRAEHEPLPPARGESQTATDPQPTNSVAPTGESSLAAPSLAGWQVDELVDVAPAAPSKATDKGVVVINGGNELFLAKVGPLPRDPRPVPSPIALIPDQKGPFALGRGPAIAGHHAYWVTSHFLLRRPIVPPLTHHWT